MKTLWRKWYYALLLHPAFLALPISFLFILTIPDIFDKYTIRLVFEKILKEEQSFEYYDLDHDGASESFYATHNFIGGSAIAIQTHTGVLNQWNIEGVFIQNQPKCIVGDYNNDSKDEIYAFTLKSDSLIINGIDYQQLEKPFIANRLIEVRKSFEKQADFILKHIAITDLTGDGFKEIVFAISTGFGLNPRKVYAYDVKNDHLFCSPELGGHLIYFDVEDIDNDGLAEIAVTNYGPGNIKDKTLPMQDTCSYVIVLDNDLDFLFHPIASPGTYSGISNQFIFSNNQYNIVSLWGYNTFSPDLPVLKIYDIKGNLLHERRFSYEDRTKYTSLSVLAGEKGVEYIVLGPHYDKFIFFDHHLNYKKELDIINGYRKMEFFDFDQDGQKEVFFELTKPGEWCILRNSLKHPVGFKTHISADDITIYPILRGKNSPQFCFQLDNHQYILEYQFNQMFYWQYPFYLVIYLLTLLFILLIRNLQRIQINKKNETEKKMTELQLLSLRNQMDPHFTFNLLNTIGSVILQNKSDESYDMLMKFSRMIRTTISSANKICRSLEEELSFVKNYLELQQFRYQGNFMYQIDLDPVVDTRDTVPKMILQTYVENALKHGLLPRKEGGVLKVEIYRRSNYLELSVTDNGVGRHQAKVNGTVSTGVGLTILNQYYQVLNRRNTRPITEEFIDLIDEFGNPAGTRVVVCIPEGFVFPGEIDSR